MTRNARGGKEKNKTLRARSSCRLHLLCWKRGILRPLWGLMWWGNLRGALQLKQRLQDQCSLTLRRHTWQSRYVVFYLSQMVAQEKYQPIFSSLKCVQYLGLVNLKKSCQAARYPYHRYFVFSALLKLAQLSHNWEQALNEVGVGSHCCFHLIHSDDSLIITQIYKTSSKYGNNILQCLSMS